MAKGRGRVGAVCLVVLGGCLGAGVDGLPQVSSNPFGQPGQQTTFNENSLAGQPSAPEEVAKRVAVLGQQIIARNPDIGLMPHFITAGVQQPEIMHVGTNDVYITEGLVNRCTNDGQLTALLCLELGKMISERELLAGSANRKGHAEPPPAMPVGRDSGGVWGSPDGTRFMELVQFEKNHPRNDDPPPPPPDPAILARRYIVNAGFTVEDLDAAAPLQHAADANGALYRKMKALQPGSGAPK